MPKQVIMPQLGESVVEGTVTKWLKNVGDTVAELESLLEVNTDKVDTEIPSPAAGTLLQILIPEGVTVKAGTVLAWIGQPGESAPSPAKGSAPEVVEPVTAKEPAAVNQEEARQPVQAAGRSRELGFISPIVARIAQENNIDLSRVTGTGEGGRITKKDVLAYVEQGAKEAPAAAAWETPGEGDLFRPTEMVFGEKKTDGKAEQAPASRPAGTPAGGDQVMPLSAMRRKIAEHMVASKRTAPHVTTVMEADMQRVVAHYQANKDAFARSGGKLTYTAYFAVAAIQALRAFPPVNSSWTEAGILIHPRVNLGIAVSLAEEGLIVPVIKDAEALSLFGLARAVGDLAERARSHKLQPEDVRDGTFTITNHGISGSLFATPIINQPQSGILGVGIIQKRVVVIEDAAGGDLVAIRPMVYLSFTFDHRVLDGVSADRFLARVVETLENWR